MKRKKSIIILIIIVVMSILSGTAVWINNENKIRAEKKKAEEEKIREQKRYEEILNKFEEAVVENLNATFVLRNEYNCTHYNGENLTSGWLIYQGNLKKEDMLDVDGENYCKALAKTYMGDNCNIEYKLYLSCQNRTDEGFENW